jgi:hypothetical protein
MPEKRTPTLRQVDVLPPAGAEHYRDLSIQLRELAQRCRFAHARLELAQLAVKFDGRAERLRKGWAL